MKIGIYETPVLIFNRKDYWITCCGKPVGGIYQDYESSKWCFYFSRDDTFNTDTDVFTKEIQNQVDAWHEQQELLRAVKSTTNNNNKRRL